MSPAKTQEKTENTQVHTFPNPRVSGEVKRSGCVCETANHTRELRDGASLLAEETISLANEMEELVLLCRGRCEAIRTHHFLALSVSA